MGDIKEVQIVYRLFLVNCYLLQVPRLPSQPCGRLSDWLNWLELAWQYIAMTRNNLCIISISLADPCGNTRDAGTGKPRKSTGLPIFFPTPLNTNSTLHRSRTSEEMGRNTPKNCIFWKYIVGGVLLHPGAGWGLIFWTMSFYNPKKFISRSF